MKQVGELYPDYDGGYGPCDYTPIIDAIGEVVVRADQDDYQGDTWVLFRRGEQWGYLCLGWGSCSGCDELQGVDSVHELQELANGIEDSVQWKSLDEMREWFAAHDFEADYAWHTTEFREFVKKARAALAEATP